MPKSKDNKTDRRQKPIEESAKDMFEKEEARE